MNKTSWRVQQKTIPAGGIIEVIFPDTNPNHAIIENRSGTIVYASLKSTVSSTDYDLAVPNYGTKLFARPEPLQKIYLYAQNQANVVIYSMEADFAITAFPQTMESSGVGTPGYLGLVDVGKIISALPAGTNNIGKVDVNSLPALPAGTNNIGKVDVNSLPALPAGTNNIGKVDVNSIPNVEPIGWTWAQITATSAGDIIIKPGPGKVAMLVNDSTATITLKDGTNQAWKSGDFIGYGCPLKCNTNITVNFSDAGTAWILYL